MQRRGKCGKSSEAEQALHKIQGEASEAEQVLHKIQGEANEAWISTGIFTKIEFSTPYMNTGFHEYIA